MDSLFSLAGKKAVITGCATGIGKGMAAGLARAGADIIALDIGAGVPVLPCGFVSFF